jgi:hypothetical protein
MVTRPKKLTTSTTRKAMGTSSQVRSSAGGNRKNEISTARCRLTVLTQSTVWSSISPLSEPEPRSRAS